MTFQLQIVGVFLWIAVIHVALGSECQVSPWGQWAECVGNCAFAMRVRNRIVEKPPFPEVGASKGVLIMEPCPPLYQIQQCVPSRCLTGDTSGTSGNGIGDFARHQEARGRPVDGHSDDPTDEILDIAKSQLQNATVDSQSLPSENEGSVTVDKHSMQLKSGQVLLAHSQFRPMTVLASEEQVQKLMKQLQALQTAKSGSVANAAPRNLTNALQEYEEYMEYEDDEIPTSSTASASDPSRDAGPIGSGRGSLVNAPEAVSAVPKVIASRPGVTPLDSAAPSVPRMKPKWKAMSNPSSIGGLVAPGGRRVLPQSLSDVVTPDTILETSTPTSTSPPTQSKTIKTDAAVTNAKIRPTRRRRTTTTTTTTASTPTTATSSSTSPSSAVITSAPKLTNGFTTDTSAYDYVEYEDYPETMNENTTIIWLNRTKGPSQGPGNTGLIVSASTAAAVPPAQFSKVTDPSSTASNSPVPAPPNSPSSRHDAAAVVVSVIPFSDDIAVGTDVTVPMPLQITTSFTSINAGGDSALSTAGSSPTFNPQPGPGSDHLSSSSGFEIGSWPASTSQPQPTLGTSTLQNTTTQPPPPITPATGADNLSSASASSESASSVTVSKNPSDSIISSTTASSSSVSIADQVATGEPGSFYRPNAEERKAVALHSNIRFLDQTAPGVATGEPPGRYRTRDPSAFISTSPDGQSENQVLPVLRPEDASAGLGATVAIPEYKGATGEPGSWFRYYRPGATPEPIGTARSTTANIPKSPPRNFESSAESRNQGRFSPGKASDFEKRQRPPTFDADKGALGEPGGKHKNSKVAAVLPSLPDFPSDNRRLDGPIDVTVGPLSTTAEPSSQARPRVPVRFNITLPSKNAGSSGKMQISPVIKPASAEKRKIAEHKSAPPVSTSTSRPLSTQNFQALLDNVHKPCGVTFGNRRCCKIPPRQRCPDGSLSQLAFRWFRQADTDRCVPYNYGYCGTDLEQLEKPIKFQEECYEVCFMDEEKRTMPIFQDLRFKDGVRIAGPSA